METAALTPTSRPLKDEMSKSHKRDCGDDDDDLNTSDPVAESVVKGYQAKRFKGCLDSSLEDPCCESPVNIGALVRPRRILPHKTHFDEQTMNSMLSPITEISNNLSDTTLNTPSVAAGTYEDGTTPVRRFSNSHSPSHKPHQFRKLQNEEQKDGVTNSADGNDDDDLCSNDKLGDEDFQGQRSAARCTHYSRRLNMETAMHDMMVDELSFYDDDESAPHQARLYAASPQLMGLLSPEGSPRRFRVVEKCSATKFSKQTRVALQEQKPNAQNVANGGGNGNGSAAISPKGFRVLHSLSSCSMESSMDDEYLEFFEMESLDQQQQQQQQRQQQQQQSSSALLFPSDLNSLISGQIIKNSSASASGSASDSSPSPSPMRTPEMRRPSARRCLSMTENCHQQYQSKTPEPAGSVGASTTPFSSRLNVNFCFKRPEPPSTACSPIQTKRYRGAEKENLDGSFTGLCAMASANCSTVSAAAAAAAAATTVSAVSNSACSTVSSSGQVVRPTLRKCMSMNDAEIMSALARSESQDEPDLIGDFSKPYVLPLIEGRHRDLKSISSNTVARLLNGDFDDQVASYKIIDCRYPYEFEGGHIRGAKNLYTQEQIVEEFLSKKNSEQQPQQQQAPTESAGHKRNIIIFHCEFSSERGPKLSRFLRNNDRARNTNAYPALDYPEIYLLHNGYKEFYEMHAELCDPVAYRPMLEPSYNEAYRHFRAKSKSWNGDGLGGMTVRQKKSRSRLLL